MHSILCCIYTLVAKFSNCPNELQTFPKDVCNYEPLQQFSSCSETCVHSLMFTHYIILNWISLHYVIYEAGYKCVDLWTCIIMLPVQYSWFRLFWYGYFNICYWLFVSFCLYTEFSRLICNKISNSKFNLEYSEMQLDELHYWKFTEKLLKLTWIIWNSLGDFWN